MRIIQVARGASDTIEVNWMWLPTFIGQNSVLIKALVDDLQRAYPPPFEATPETLDGMHGFALQWLSEKINIPGVRDYLEGITKVTDEVF